MSYRKLINSDSNDFWKWWNSAHGQSEFRPYIMEVKSSARRRDRY